MFLMFLILSPTLTVSWIDFGYLPSDFVLQDFMVPGQNYGNLRDYRFENDNAGEKKNILSNGKIVSSKGRIRLLGKRGSVSGKLPLS